MVCGVIVTHAFHYETVAPKSLDSECEGARGALSRFLGSGPISARFES